MPLTQGSSRADIEHNIRVEIAAGKDPKQAEAIAYHEAGKDSVSAQEIDHNGYIEIKGNPLSKVGVFPYSGRQIDPKGTMGLDHDKIYSVFRPPEELMDEECIQSFRLLPLIDDHAALSMYGEPGTMAPEEKGVHGTTGEEVFYDAPYLKSTLRIFSAHVADQIKNSKKDLSIGYTCEYYLDSGNFNGEFYTVVQRKLRGNHVAIVLEGRSGPDVSVLDRLHFTYDSMDIKMSDEEKKTEDEGEMTLANCFGMLKALEEQFRTMQGATAADIEEKEVEDGSASTGEAAEGEAADEEETEKKDAEDEFPEKKKDAMDQAITRREFEAFKKNSIKTVLKETSQANALALSLGPDIGTFDSAEMTLSEVAKYGVKKLKLDCAEGQELATLNGYLAGKKTTFSSVAHDSAISILPKSMSDYAKEISGDK